MLSIGKVESKEANLKLKISYFFGATDNICSNKFELPKLNVWLLSVF
jgi:hypothetical protein